MSHPALGAYGKNVLMGEIAGTIAASILNATLSSTAAAVLKTIIGIGAGYYGLQRTDPTGVMIYQAGVRLLTSVVEQLSYPSESRRITYDVAKKRPFYLRLDEWQTIGVQKEQLSTPPQSVHRVVVREVSPPPPPPQQVVVKEVPVQEQKQSGVVEL
jgi:hypothetical protein